ncbi:MAG: TlyA family RNA methyltransferase [Lentisphaerae bacterium]|nr:TlyA family RNA methyltransferase [Lentisphaerota bacterium]
MSKKRLDLLVVGRGLAESRERAQRLIMAGLVRVDGQVSTKPGHSHNEDVSVEVSTPPRFVSRGGEKLEAAFDLWELSVDGLVCVDVGASTGGFTDCLLSHGATRVYAVDVGKGQLDWKLRNDPRVVVMEKVNARYLDGSGFSEAPQFATVDVSFISLTLVLPAVIRVLSGEAELVTLIKPQFEAGRAQVQRGGVVRDESVRAEVVDRIRVFGTETLGLRWCESVDSPVRGPAGNVEVLAHWKKG